MATTLIPSDPPPSMTKTVPTTVQKLTEGVQSGRYEFTWSTPNVDRDHDVIPADAWDWDNYVKNPVVLFGHDYSKLPVGRATRLPAERDGTMKTTVELLPKGTTKEADEMRALLDAGFPLAISPGLPAARRRAERVRREHV